MQVPSVVRAGSSETLSQRISIPRSSLLEIELRRLDRTRTWGMVGLALLAGGAIAFKAFDGDSGMQGPGNNGGGTEARVPLQLRLRW